MAMTCLGYVVITALCRWIWSEIQGTRLGQHLHGRHKHFSHVFEHSKECSTAFVVWAKQRFYKVIARVYDTFLQELACSSAGSRYAYSLLLRYRPRRLFKDLNHPTQERRIVLF
jgi:exonuclease I